MSSLVRRLLAKRGTPNASYKRSLFKAASVVPVLYASGCATGANALERANQQQIVQPLAVIARPLVTRPVHDPEIRLESRGSEPHISLRLRAAPTTRQQIEVSQAGRVTFSVRDSAGNEKTEAAMRAQQNYEFPTLTVRASLQVRSSSEGERVVEVTIDQATASQAVDSIMNQQAKALVSGLDKKSAVLTMTDSGRVIGAEPVIGDGERSGSIILGFLDRNVITLADPLPTEAVGVGASWTVSTAAESAGLPATVTRRYIITSISDTEVEATITRTVSFSPGSHQGTRIVSGSSLSESGTATWPLDGIIGVVSYTGAGVIKHDIGAGDTLNESIRREVSSSTLTLVAPPRPTTTTEAPPAPTSSKQPDTTAAPGTTTAPGTTSLPGTTTTKATTTQPTTTSTTIAAAPDTERPSEPGQPELKIVTNDDNEDVPWLQWNPANDDNGIQSYQVFSTDGTWMPDAKANQEDQDSQVVEHAELIASPDKPKWKVDADPGTYFYFIKAVDAAGNVSWRSGITEITLK